MKKLYGWVALVLVIAVVAVGALLLETRSSTSAISTSTSAGEGSNTSTPGGTGQPPLAVPMRTERPTALITKAHRYPDGVEVAVTRIRRSTLTKKFLARDLEKGRPIQILTVRVRNSTGQPLNLLPAYGAMRYGRKHKAAVAVEGKGISWLSGVIRPGQAKTGTIGFAVPKKYLHQAMFTFNLDSAHAPAVFLGSLAYSPGFSTVFNYPTGSQAQQLAIIKHIDRTIDATPKGATIRIAQYAFDITSSAKKLVAAHKRGVHIQMLIDHHKPWGAEAWQNRVTTKQTRMLIRELGRSKKKKSFVTTCKAACMSSRTSAMHAKFYLFSKVGNSRWVSMIGSANITETNSALSWNNNHTIIGDQKIYDSLTKYFRDMIKDKNRPNYYRTTTSGKYKMYFYPRKEKQGSRDVALLDVLDHVSCKGAAKGYGAKGGRTIIRLAMYMWTSKRLDIADQLWRLHNKGCKVRIILNAGGGRLSRQVRHTLLKPSKKYGKIQVYNAWVDHNGDGRANLYMHHKTLMINGVWFGRPNTKIVYAGSQNFVGNATRDNNELVLRIRDDKIYDKYAEDFDRIRAKRPRVRW